MDDTRFGFTFSFKLESDCTLFLALPEPTAGRPPFSQPQPPLPSNPQVFKDLGSQLLRLVYERNEAVREGLSSSYPVILHLQKQAVPQWANPLAG